MLNLNIATNKPLHILCLGAHSDDIEIGCGGTILRLIQEHHHVSCDWVVFSTAGLCAQEAQTSAEKFLKGISPQRIRLLPFQDGFFPYQGADIKAYFETLKGVNPDIIFTHHRNDAHQDHRLIAELTWNTFRNHLIFEYEIPKYDGDLGLPNCFIQLDKQLCDTKINILLESFPTQTDKHWFDSETFYALLRLRGLESASPTKYAEAFHCRKIAI